MQLFSSFVHPINLFCISNRFSRGSFELYSLGWGLVFTACFNLSGFQFGCRQQAVNNSLIWVLKTDPMLLLLLLLLLVVLQAEILSASLLLDQGIDNFS